jgi:hypothetical protein
LNVEGGGRIVRKLPERALPVWAIGDRPREIAGSPEPRPRDAALSKVFPSGGNVLLDALMEVSGS